MKLNHLIDQEILTLARDKSHNIRMQTLELLEILSEVNRRKLYCDLGYSSLFYYIVRELKFSESQAGIYCNIIYAKITEIKPVVKMIAQGELSLDGASQAGSVIRENRVVELVEKNKIINSFKGLNRAQSRAQGDALKHKAPPKTKVTIILDSLLQHKINQFKKKYNLPELMEVREVLISLLDKELTQKTEVRENKTITPKTRTLLKIESAHQCQFRLPNGQRCQETRNLEIDHRIPRALGGSNHPENLRVLCRQHNQRSAIRMGVNFGNKNSAPDSS